MQLPEVMSFQQLIFFTKSGYNTYRGRTKTEYQNKRYNINEKDEGTQDDRVRDGGTNFILRIKTRLILHEHDDDEVYFLQQW